MILEKDKKIRKKCLSCDNYLKDYECKRRIMTNTEFMCNVKQVKEWQRNI